MTISHLPAQTQIAFSHLKVIDIQRALVFYQERLGFHLTHRHNGTAYLAAGAGQPVSIVLSEDRAAAPKPIRTTGLYHIAIKFPHRADLAAALRRLLNHNWRFLGAADHGVSEALYTIDPDGNGVELYVDRPAAQWPRSRGQIEMSSDPLDINALLGVQGAGQQHGLAVDTSVGHVHLQVADLDRSRQFYNELLGMEVTQSNYPGALFLAAGDYHHHVGINVWAGEGIPRPPADSVGLVSFGLQIPDADALQAAADRLRQAGFKVETREDPYLGAGFFVRDPDGNGVELIGPVA